MNGILLLLAISLSGPAAGGTVAPPALECVFEHPRYVGSCTEEVTPQENETHLQACQAILACLNNPQCVKSYCQATTLRGGWALVSPRPAPQSGQQE
jgi:hypothetical protein